MNSDATRRPDDEASDPSASADAPRPEEPSPSPPPPQSPSPVASASGPDAARAEDADNHGDGGKDEMGGKKGGGEGKKSEETPKEVVMSVIMSFALVFIFTRFVVASYVIPTGSMAPTLMGAHVRVQSPESGLSWAINPSRYGDAGGRVPLPAQDNIAIEDTVTGRPITSTRERLRFGDRIFVLHYLYAIFEPSRWDVVVFKYPGNARENYIKRLVGLPGEQIFIADGDVFTRPVDATGAPDGEWRIRRKPTRIQEDLWSEIYSSEHRPLRDQHDGRPWRDYWIAEDWSRSGASYVHESDGPARLRWNHSARPIDDWVAYNDTDQIRAAIGRGQFLRYPVSDVRLRADLEPLEEGLRAVASIRARGHEFRAVLEGDSASIQMRPRSPSDASAAWTTLDQAAIRPLAPGEASDVAFWHVDQRLELHIRGRRVARAEYDWDPWERLSNVFHRDVDENTSLNLADPRFYEPTQVEWTFEGAPLAAHRVGLDRDVWYQPVPGRDQRATSPDSIVTLDDGQYFVLGDNSAASGDSRRWDSIDPWIARAYDDRVGVVARELMMGKAFFVFWPSPSRIFGLPVIPDFGRLRFIR